ncbi:MAG: hypothetical protein GY842_15345 [bacterium]|nr:hypothetical protein [bacterium]
MSLGDTIRKCVKPLSSRKIRVALTTVLAAYAAEWGLEVSEELVLTILAVGVALILGIAHEDHGRDTPVQTPAASTDSSPSASG